MAPPSINYTNMKRDSLQQYVKKCLVRLSELHRFITAISLRILLRVRSFLSLIILHAQYLRAYSFLSQAKKTLHMAPFPSSFWKTNYRAGFFSTKCTLLMMAQNQLVVSNWAYISLYTSMTQFSSQFYIQRGQLSTKMVDRILPIHYGGMFFRCPFLISTWQLCLTFRGRENSRGIEFTNCKISSGKSYYARMFSGSYLVLSIFEQSMLQGRSQFLAHSAGTPSNRPVFEFFLILMPPGNRMGLPDSSFLFCSSESCC